MSLTHDITPETLYGDIESQDARIRVYDWTHPNMASNLALRDARNAKKLASRIKAINLKNKLVQTGKYSEEDLRKDPHLRSARRQIRDDNYTEACRGGRNIPSLLEKLSNINLSLSEIIETLEFIKRDNIEGDKLRLNSFHFLSEMLKFKGDVSWTKCESLCSCCDWSDKKSVETNVADMNSNCYLYGDNIYHRERAKNLMKHAGKGIFKCVPELHETGVSYPEDYMTGLGLFVMNKFKSSSFSTEFSEFDFFVNSTGFAEWFTSLFL